MKKRIVTTVLLAVAIAAFATPIIEFTGWNNLIESSPDIIIARPTGTFSSTSINSTNHPMATTIVDGGMSYPIEVITVLKGVTKPGPAQLWSSFSSRLGELPHQGDMYLVFAGNHGSGLTNCWYNAIEDYRIVFIAPDIYSGAWTNALAGKALKEQIKMILKCRLGSLNEQRQKDQDEEKRIEEGLKELNM